MTHETNYEFPTNEDILGYLEKDPNHDKSVAVITYVNKRLEDENLEVKDFRWTSLVNHIIAMVDRATSGEKLNGITVDMFEDVPKQDIDFAKEIADYIGGLEDPEGHLLSVHFGAARTENN